MRISKAFRQIDRFTVLTLWVGLFARLLLMPLAANSDLMSTYWAAHQVAFHHEFAGLQTLLRYFHAGYLWLVSPILPLGDSIWIHRVDDPLLNPFVSVIVTSTQGWFEFVSQPQIYRTLFLLKLPYLGFDLACAYLVYRLGSDRVQSRFMFAFWWLNPILLFAIYVFGRHEVIALFFLLFSIYLVRKEKHNWGLLVLGIAIAIRYYAIFLLPFFVLSIQPEWKKRLQAFIIGLTPWFVLNITVWAVTASTEATRLISYNHTADTLLAMRLQLGTWDDLYIFPLLYFLLVLHRLYNKEYGLRSLEQYSLIALLLLFATASTGQSPHYWTWLLPFLTIGVAEDHRLLPLFLAQVMCLVVYSFIGGRSTAGYLFAPISPDFFWSLTSPVEIIERFVSPEMVISMARTAFSAVSLWMAYLVFRRIKTGFVIDMEAEGES